MSQSKPIVALVGESNPYGADPDFALYPAPDGCSGQRLCCLILGMRRREYLEAFERVNLCAGPWSLSEARRRAADLLGEGGRFVLLGRKVADAFGVPHARPFSTVDEVLLCLPHPSGLCRSWSEEGAVRRAREAVAAFAPEVAHLLGVSDE